VGRRDLAAGKTTVLDLGAWLCWEDESGQGLRPPKARSWAPRGQTPVVKVTGKGYGRVAVAGLVCAKPGPRTRLIYRTRVRRGRPGEPKGFTARAYASCWMPPTPSSAGRSSWCGTTTGSTSVAACATRSRPAVRG
jgi:hypothetical protein